MHCTSLISFVFMGIGAITVAIAADEVTAGRSGKAVFEANCAGCHTGGYGAFIASAPEIGDREYWKKLAPKGVDGLTATTLAGIGDMGPRGECSVCTDAEIRAAVEYMLEKSQ